MEFIDFIVMGVVLLIIGAAAAYIIKAKKSGKKCIGCPDSCSCGSKKAENSNTTSSCSGNCSSCCGCHEEKK